MTRKRGITGKARRFVAQGNAEAQRTLDSLGAKAQVLDGGKRRLTGDSFENLAARLGIGADNLSSASTYGFNPISRIRTLMEWQYRGSWLVGKAVDCIPQDMVKRGITLTGDNDPKEVKTVMRGLRNCWPRILNGLRWGRLYGGCIVVMMIKGQDPATPLSLRSVRKGSLLNLLVLDRWMVEPSLEDLVTDLDSDDLGLPKYYWVTADAPALPRMRIHHTRVLRFLGVDLPYWQCIAENLWGMSVIERLYDRLIAFDSGTTGVAQLMYRSDIRTYKVEKLRELIAAGGDAYNAFVKQMQLNSAWQSNERMFVIDTLDDFQRLQYSFAGVAETLLQFGMQISGALDIPLVRLFGQSPGGLNSTGESDLVTYYDGINQRQETDFRPQLARFLPVLQRSCGYEWDDDEQDFDFNPLMNLSDEQRANIGERITNQVLALEESGLISQRTALKELQVHSARTGIWTSITDEDVEAADDALPPSAAEMAAQQQEQAEAAAKAQEEQQGQQAELTQAGEQREQERHEAEMGQMEGQIGGGTVRAEQVKPVRPRTTLQ